MEHGTNHYDPNQPRDWHGRWTLIRDLPPRSLPPGWNRDPECYEEWRHAHEFCEDLAARKKLGDTTGFGRWLLECMMGQVSERCGGNPVDRNPRPRWRKR